MYEKMETDALLKIFSQLPEDSNKIPTSLFEYDQEVIAELIEEQIKEHKPALRSNDGSDFTRALLADLAKFKTRLGGAPHFQGGIVTLNNDDSNKTFMGQPLPAVKDWFRKILKENWRPTKFWVFVAKYFNITKENQTQYENIHARIQRFGLLCTNREKINEILDSNDETRHSEFGQITGMAWHPKDNHPSIEKAFMDMIDRFMTDYYHDAKEKGDEALLEYFNAFDGVCFEDRCSKIQDYIEIHPLASDVEDVKIDILMPNNLSDYADYTPQSDINAVVIQEISEYYAAHGDMPTPQQFWDRLEAKGVTGQSFPATPDSKEMSTLNADYLNQDFVRQYFIEELCMMQAGDKIVTQDFDMKVDAIISKPSF